METVKILKAIATAALILAEQQDHAVPEPFDGPMTQANVGPVDDGTRHRNINDCSASVETVAAAPMSARRRQG